MLREYLQTKSWLSNRQQSRSSSGRRGSFASCTQARSGRDRGKLFFPLAFWPSDCRTLSILAPCQPWISLAAEKKIFISFKEGWHRRRWQKMVNIVRTCPFQFRCTRFFLLSECYEWSAAPTSPCLRRWPRGCFSGEYCIGGKSVAAPRVNCFLAPTCSPSTRLGRSPVPFFNSLVRPDRESNPAYQLLVARARTTVLLRRNFHRF